MVGFVGSSGGAAATRNRSCRICVIAERSAVGDILVNGEETGSEAQVQAVAEDVKRPFLFMPSIGSDGKAVKRAFRGVKKEVVKWDVEPARVKSWGDIVDWVNAEYDAERRTIVAESTGGTVALRMAIGKVGGVEKLVLVNPVTSPRDNLTRAANMVPRQLRNALPDFDEFVAERSDLMRKIRFSDEELEQIDIPVVLIVTEADPVHPSYRESERLLRHIPKAVRYTVQDGGHFLLRGGEVNLKSVLETADKLLDELPTKVIFRTHVSRCRVPGLTACIAVVLAKVMEENDEKDVPADELKKAKDQTAFLRRAFSPVFVGFNRIPDTLPGERPILFVGNHTVIGILDLPFFVEHFLNERGVLPRGLAHPIVFESMNPGASSGISMESFGATRVTPANLYRLMSEKKWAFLFPGGVREANKKKSELYSTVWPKDQEFVRTAAKFNAIVIPYGTVGPEDTLRIVMDSNDYAKVPGLTEWMQKQTQVIETNPRKWKKNIPEMEVNALFPLVRLAPPSRQYCKFGRPIDLADVDYKDKETCQAIYEKTRGEVDQALKDLLTERENDTYFDFQKRILYESANETPAPASAWQWSVRGGMIPNEDI